MKKIITASSILLFLLACSLPFAVATNPVDIATATSLADPATGTPVPTLPPPTETFTATLPPTVTPTSTSTFIPVVESLKATVTADLLTCRYGPGPEYLYLIAFNKTTPLALLGRTDGNNWVLVENKPQRCWVNLKFIEIKGDPQTLKVMYPAEYQLPVSPYYRPPTVLSAERSGNSVKVTWTDITLRAGDEEDENMFIYIIEVWRCEGGKMIFDPLPSNYPEVTFVDEAGCDVASHGRVFFQEKHGYAGPAEIPWPQP